MTLLPRLGLGALLATLALAPLLGGSPVGYQYAMAAYGGDPMLGALRALLIVATLCLLLFAPPRPTPLPAFAKIALWATWAGFGLTLLSLLTHSAFLSSPVLLFAMLPDTLTWLCYALVFTLALRSTGDSRSPVWIASALVAGGALCAILGAQQFGAAPDRAAFRNAATFVSPNFAAGFLALLLPVGVALFVSAARSLLPTVAAGAACALMFGVLISTASRAGIALALLGLAIALVLALLTARRARTSLPWARIGALVALFALMGFAFRAPLIGRAAGAATAPAASPAATTAPAPSSSGGEQSHSEAFRRETWKGTGRMAQAHPVLGAGPGTFPYLYPVYATVGWTSHAHSSYLQVAAEQGLPALAAYLVAVGAALLAGLSAWWYAARPPAPRETLDLSAPVLLCGLIGGLVAGLGRGVFDSEWTLLGNGLPFWCVAGLVAGGAGAAVAEATERVRSAAGASLSPLRFLPALGLLPALILTLVLRSGNAARDGIIAAQAAGGSLAAPPDPKSVWPPDPQLYSLSGNREEAARIEPSGKRLFQQARGAERAGENSQAVALFEKSVAAEPNNLQTRKALAEAQERSGDTEAALGTWKSIVDLSAGPVGQVRAIPEIPETIPAFAHAALAADAVRRENFTEAERLYHEAETIIEEYSNTPPVYQMTELTTLSDPMGRRAEVRALYEQVMDGRRAALRRLKREDVAASLDATEKDTLAKLDAFVRPDTGLPAKP